VEPQYPTNRAILIVMPITALIAGLVTFMRGAGLVASARGALSGLLIVFACWALGRELAPDDNAAAFLGAGLAFTSLWWWPSPSLLLLFTGLALSRIVNRSTGLTARASDSVIVSALVIWTMISLQTPLVGLVGALAFVLDARLAGPNRRQWLFAIVCLEAAAVQVGLGVTAGSWAGIEPTPQLVGTAATLLAFAILSLTLRTVSSVGDVGGQALHRSRVQGGMLSVWLLSLVTVLHPEAIDVAMPMVGVMAGVVLTGFAGRLRSH
jgi:hypothetical protein